MSSALIDHQVVFKHIEELGFFDGKELPVIKEALARSGRKDNWVQTLVNSGKITRFQAEKIVAGKAKELIVGQYLLVNQLGKGGIGRVYKAIHRTMNREVAIKLLAPKFTNTAKARQLFQREVLAAGRLVHPNIATAYDANTQGNHHYLVMEHVDGPNLDQLVNRQGPLRPGLACEIIRQAALALQHASDMGMLHRDIKPANILVQKGTGNTFTVKVVDFGLARLQVPGVDGAGEMGTIVTKQNTVMGTPDYLSPEQARNMHKLDIRSDLYSLGCTFYFLLTGRVPFPKGTTVEKLIRHAKAEPVPIASLRSDVPAEMIQVVQKSMAKDPNNRFQTPTELVQTLEPLANPKSSSNWNMRTLPAKSLETTPNQGMEGTWPPDLCPTILPLPENVANKQDRFPVTWLLAAGGVLAIITALTFLIARAI